MADKEPDFDLAVIGAGINGAGIARDAALRGLRVIVLDKNDFCSGTSAASSRLIHGGLRYLEYGELPLVYESLHERRYLRDIASHLVKPLRISIPIYENARRGPLLVRLGMLLYDVLSWNKRMPRHEMLNRDELQAAAPALNIQGLRAGARYYDAQVTFAERLVLENLLAARAAGADIRTYSRVERLEFGPDCDAVVSVEDTIDGEQYSVSASVVVNASGPWVDAVLATAIPQRKRLVGGTKGSHIVVSRFAGAPDDAFYTEALSDGRPFFIIPWNGLMLIGTTDIRYDESLDHIRASEPELDYLIEETNRVFPSAELDYDDIHYAYAGVRPLPARDKGPESAITRKHIIKRHRGVAKNLLSIIGGKLTTYRSLAEQTVDRVGRLLRRRLPPCRTHDTLLPGGWGLDEAREALAKIDGLSQAGIERIVGIYGGRAAAIAEIAQVETGMAACFDSAGRILKAEAVFVAREEFPRTLGDVVYRRMLIGLDADQGRPCYEAIAAIVAPELGWSDSEMREQLRRLEEYSASLRSAG